MIYFIYTTAHANGNGMIYFFYTTAHANGNGLLSIAYYGMRVHMVSTNKIPRNYKVWYTLYAPRVIVTWWVSEGSWTATGE